MVKKQESTPKQPRTYLSQSDVPSMGISEALQVGEAIGQQYGYKPTAPLLVAKALDIKPGGSAFRMLTGASTAYGITEGAAQSSEISLTDLGMRIVRPLIEDDDLAAKREAFLKPRIVGEFLRKYNGAALPRQDIGEHVLHDLGVPRDKTSKVLALITEDAHALGLTEEIKGARYVHLAGSKPPEEPNGGDDGQEVEDGDQRDSSEAPDDTGTQSLQTDIVDVDTPPLELRVFISHGKNMEIVEQVETMLGMADLSYEIAVNEESTAIPVPEKVFSAMRRCTAAVIIVSVDESKKDDGDNFAINENVLIEIGAAFVLYDRKVVLVWDKRLAIPTNLQGLYRCGFEGDELSWKAGMKLMKAIKGFRKTQS